MDRGASAAVKSAWAAEASAPAHLLELVFDDADGGTVRMTDSYRAITWAGNHYFAAGHLLDFSGLTESLDLRVADISVKLSGVDQVHVATFLEREYLNRRLVIYQMFFDASEVLVVDPLAIHDGRMDAPRLLDDLDQGKTTIEIASHDQFSDFDRQSGRHTNSTDQGLFFPDDEAFDDLAVINSRPFTWGHLKELPATGLGAALSRLVHSDSLSKLSIPNLI